MGITTGAILVGTATAVATAGGPFYRAVEIGGLDGGGAKPMAMNDAGQVTGSSSSTAFRYADGSIENLAPGLGWSEGQVIGPDGTVAGRVDGMIMVCRPGERLQVVGSLGGSAGNVHDINAAGSFVGAWASSGSPIDWQAFIHTETHGLKPLGTLGGDESWANAINDAGQVAGYAWLETTYHAFRWADGEMVDLGTLGGTTSSALDINAAGDVVGWARTANGENHAFRYTEAGGMEDIRPFPDATSSTAVAINDAGVIIGTWTDAEWNNRAFRMDPAGAVVELGTGGGDDVIWTTVSKVNEAGDVLGLNLSEVYEVRPFLWTAETGEIRLLDRIVTDLEDLFVFGAVELTEDGRVLLSGFEINHDVAVILEPLAPGDLDGDGVVNGTDLGLLLAAWGPCPEPCVADIDGNGAVDGADVGLLLAAWE